MQSITPKNNRQSFRLKDYDYSQPGSYFITICAHQHKNIFGEIGTVRAILACNKEGSESTSPQISTNILKKSTSINQVTSQKIPLSEDNISKMHLNNFGEIVSYTWNDLENHNSGIKLGEFVIMPNHIHGIIHILDPENYWDDFIPSNFIYRETVGAGSEPAPTNLATNDGARSVPTSDRKQNPLSEIVRQFKTFSARRINTARKTPGVSVWQRNYYEHIIRNQESYDQIVDYIQTNPLMWISDKLYAP